MFLVLVKGILSRSSLLLSLSPPHPAFFLTPAHGFNFKISPSLILGVPPLYDTYSTSES